MNALLIIDMQYDFLPGGALAVAGGDEIILPIIEIIPKYDLVVFTQDWHPKGHKSFASSHPGRAEYEEIIMHGHPQKLWPDHCVQGTRGAEIHEYFRRTGGPMGDRSALDRAAWIVRKGMDIEVDSYSAFFENWGPRVGYSYTRRRTGLMGAMCEMVVRKITCVGLARDFCVKWSAEDSAKTIPTEVIWDLTRAVNPANDDQVRDELRKAEVKVI